MVEAYTEHTTLSRDDAFQILDECTATYTSERSVIYSTESAHPNLARFLGSGVWLSTPQHLSHRNDYTDSYVIKCPFQYSDFCAERSMLEACNRRCHPHVIPLVASFDFEKTGCLIMPAAAMNLTELLSRHVQNETEGWLISQLAGLVDALAAIHGHLRSVEGGDMFGIHGDIKAGNVLVLQPIDRPETPAILQLADFGSSQLFDSIEKASNIRNAAVSGTYTAPECVLERSYSQAADVWSFSCLVLELLIWLKHGPQSLQSFATSRMHKSTPYGMSLTSDYFFNLEPTSGNGGDLIPRVRHVNLAVTTRIDELRSSRGNGEGIRSLLELLEQHLLVVNPAQRMSAEELARRLEYLVGGDRPKFRLEEDTESH